VNLGALAWFKYAGFLAANVNALLGTHLDFGHVALPLAISFFTFTQIAYLVDAFHGVTREYNFRWYLLFVSFFPHLIAGPIVLYRSLMPQFARSETWRFHAENFAVGVTVFAFGLFKKVVIADTLSPIAGGVFGGLDRGAPGLAAAWLGALAYTFQLYFDFSGYSDMAIGSGACSTCAFRKTSTLRTRRANSSTSGGAGTSRSRTSCAITSTSRSAAIAKVPRGGP
jgi:alginate O-acetyltransferase complex protein AlgI